MNGNNNFLSNRLNKYSIRKMTVGTASLLIGATLLFGVNNDAQAAEESANENGEETLQPTQSEAAGVSEKETTAEVTESEVAEVANDVDQESDDITQKEDSTSTEQTQEVSEEVSSDAALKDANKKPEMSEPASDVEKTETELPESRVEIPSTSPQTNSKEVTHEIQPADEPVTTEATVQPLEANSTGVNTEKSKTPYEAAVALSEALERSKAYATPTSRTTFRSAFRSVTTRAATDYTGKIIDYPGDKVVKVDDPSTALAPGNINFSPKFVEGKSKSYAFSVGKDGTITKKAIATNNSGDKLAYKGNFVELNNNTPEAYVYFNNIGVSNGHIVDAIAKVTMTPSSVGDNMNTRYFFTSGRDVLSIASKNGGGASVTLTFVENKDRSVFDALYDSVQLSQTSKETMLQNLNNVKGENEKVSGLLNVYDLDDYSASKTKDERKSITFSTNEISKFYVSNEASEKATALMELVGNQVTLTSGPTAKGSTFANNKRVTVTFENKSELNYTITGKGSSGPAFHPDGLLLLEVPPFIVEDSATTSGQDDQFTVIQTVPSREVSKSKTLPTEITLGIQVPENIKLTMKENTSSLFTVDKSVSTSNHLTIVPGKNGAKNLELLKQAMYYNRIYDLPITASHDLTLADIENNTAKWQKLQKYYDKDEEVLKVPISYTFKNGVETWNDLTTDKSFAVMNVSEDIKRALRKVDEAAAAVEEAKKADQAAKNLLAEANTDGLITPTEHAALETAKQEAITKKAKATNIVNSLPKSYRGDMPAILAGLTGINVPNVNDQNENGIEDTIDAQLADAKKKVDAAKAADKAAQDALTKANADGLINPDEANKLTQLAKQAADTKAAAETAVSKLPNSPAAVKTQKDTLTNELTGLKGITVPTVNDKDSNGIADNVDAQIAAARQAVEEAKAADAAAKEKLESANADSLITPTEKAALEAAKQEAADKKAAAEEKVNALPDAHKGELPTELGKLTGITVPAVNDQNENGIADSVDTQLADAKTKVDAAKEADKAAQDALTKANADGVINPDEAAQLADLAKRASDAKKVAETAVSNLPNSPEAVKTQKESLTGELNQLNGITVPAINDKDSNGIADDVDAQIEAAKQAVEAAKAADQAAKEKLETANADGLITPTEKAALEAAKQEAADKKVAAEEKVNALPDAHKGDLPTELEKLTGITVPAVNDQNENGINDDVDAQLADAKTKVDTAKAADEAAKAALTEANEDGVISQEEAAQLADLAKRASDAKKVAETEVSNLPETPKAVKDEKVTLTETLNHLDGIKLPVVNDKDGNGIDDTVDAQIEAAKQAVEAAKAADATAKEKLEAANEDGLITPTEKAELEAAQQDAQAKKDAATDKVNALPEEHKGNLPKELEALTGINIPEVNDENENGIDDKVDAQLEEAKQAVEEAKKSDEAVKAALTEANADNVINPDEAAKLADLVKKAEDTKKLAEEKVNALPESPQTVKDQKDTLTGELTGLDSITVPEVNDANSNGVADEVDAQVEAAKQAVEEAKAADTAAKEKLEAAKADGLITPTEKAELERLQEAAASKKAEATNKVNALPESPQSVKDQKDTLTGELAGLNGITVPKVNDADENGVADEVDTQRTEAEKAVEEAKKADKAAKDALAEANADSLITPAEKAQLEAAQKEAADKKAAAQEKVDALPENQKGDLPSELEALTGINIPTVNDENANGVADEVDAQVEAAKQAVEEAKAADTAAKEKLESAKTDGLITPTEKAELERLQEEAVAKKAEATNKVNALPESPQSVKEEKTTLTDTLNGLDGITVPEVNDADGNGVADDVDAQRAEAAKAVEEAKKADKAAKDALAKAEEDNLITPAEKTQLEAAQKEAADKKAEATDKVNALPEDQKGNLPSELEALTGIDIPTVNDENANGVADEVDAQVEAAKQAVEAAKAADQAAKEKLEAANADGLITPTEKAELERLQEEAVSKKAEATNKVNALPESPQSVKEEKTTLTETLNGLDGIAVPEVNDADGNGVADDVDAQRNEAAKAVEEAKKADKVAKDALAEAKADDLITPEEKTQLEAAQKEAADKKAEATDKVNALPEDQKGDLPKELEALTDIDIPTVNDENANGVADEVDAQVEDAKQAVEAAKAADKAAKDALDKAEADGLITLEEKTQLEAAQKEAADKKATAQEKVNALPETPQSVKETKDTLTETLNGLDGITVPEVNDADANGVADDIDAQRNEAAKAVEEAKKADKAAKDALAKAEEDSLITPAEKTQLEAAQKEAADKKTAAQEKVDALPEDQKGNLSSELEALTGINIPTVNDENANGVADEVDAQVEAAKQAVEAAKAADTAAKEKLEEANADGLITPAEKAELESLQEEAVAKKAEATNKVNALPENPQSVKEAKDKLTETLNGLDGIEVPEVNDADGNGVADDVDAQRAEAAKAVEEAKKADKAAKDALAKAEEDGLITPAEKTQLEAAQKEAADKKAEATDKVNALPEDQKGNLPSELEALTGIDIPTVNDENANGVADEVDAQVEAAKQAVEAAKKADKAAKDALKEANEDGLINPEEAAKLADLAKQAEDAKKVAEEKVNALPESPQSVRETKDTLTEALNGLDGIAVPEVNDADGNGVADDVDAQRTEAEKAVEEAKAADQAAKDALAKAEEDGLITPAEKTQLEAAQKEAADKKAEATDKVNALPEDQKGNLPSELEALTGIDVPVVNDENANGVADEVDAQVEAAKQAVEAAKTADEAAKDALKEANEDGLINPEEAAKLADLAKQAEDAKKIAEEKVNALPESPQSVRETKDTLTEALNGLDGIAVPEVNDADANGVADDIDTQRTEAEKVVEEAKKADQAAKDALAKAEEDGLITPAEKAELEAAQQDAQAKKEAAQEKVDALPEDQKGNLPSELEALTGIDVPAVNDENANGVADEVDAQVEAAKQAVEKAKEADKAAKDALTEANEDGLINPEETAKLADLAKQAEEAKKAAEEKVKALPETPQSVKEEKTTLTEALNDLDGIEVPEVNDADANGVADDVDAQRAEAEKAVEEAKEADQAAKDALDKAKADGLITPAEKAELEELQKEATDKKAEATDKVNTLPEDQKGNLPSELEALTGIEIPEVNDADANGVADDVDAQRAEAEKAVEEAKAADQAAKDALDKAKADGLITPAEKAELEELQKEATDKKAEATDKVNALPEDQKGDLPSELDKLTGIEIPEVNDADANGVADDIDTQRAEAEKAVEEAKEADQAAKDALDKAKADGLITPAEKSELEKLQKEAASKKAEATDKVNALPEDQKGNLPSELDKLTGIEIPEVNDADANGV
ncbi:GA-like domain-containing protein, partial [Staphylococcus americanisciuri]